MPQGTSSGVLLQQTDLDGVRQFERSVGGEFGGMIDRLSISSELCPAAASFNLSSPARYDKPTGALPASEANYYPSADSTVRCVTYTWDTSDLLGFAAYSALFDRIATELTDALGDPLTFDEQPTEQRYEGSDRVYQRREGRWESGNTRAYTFLLHAPSGTRRVRTTVYWVP